MAEKRIRVLLTKTSLDGHDKGIRYIAQLLRDAGIEVIFSRYLLVDEALKQTIEEDVDVLGLSFYGSGLWHDTQRVLDLKVEHGLDDIRLMVGGTIMDDEKDRLLKMGIDAVFQPNVGTADDVVDFVVNDVYRG